MSKISSYSQVAAAGLTDMLIGTDVDDSNATKNFTIQQLLSLLGGGSTGAIIILPDYIDDAAAGAAGLVTGQLYQTTGTVKVKQ